MQIKNINIGSTSPPFIVAELSSNHKQDVNIALELVEQAKECGVDAVKLQTFTADSITRKDIDSKLHEACDKAFLYWDLQAKVFKRCEELGLICFSSVFDEEGVDFLEDLGCPAYKIASYEIYHFDLIEKILSTNKPIIISTGMASFNDIFGFSQTFSALNTIFLKCVSNYPAIPNQFNLRTLPDMKHQFGFEVGLSDHTSGLGISIASVTLGATMIERHFCLKRDGNVDDPYNLEPHEMKQLVKECQDVWVGMGDIDYAIQGDRQHRRSLYATVDIKKGERFTKNNIAILRPSKGITPKMYSQFLKGTAKEDICSGTPLHYRHL